MVRFGLFVLVCFGGFVWVDEFGLSRFSFRLKIENFICSVFKKNISIDLQFM